METVMEDKKPDARTIAEEAVGQIRGAPIPDAAKDQAVTPTVEVVRQLATSAGPQAGMAARSEEHTSELQSLAYLVCRLLLEKKKKLKLPSHTLKKKNIQNKKKK